MSNAKTECETSANNGRLRSQQTFTVLTNTQIAAGTYRIELQGNTVGLVVPGQFVNIEVPGFYLRRPLSVCEVTPGNETEGRLVLIYKILGQGTKELATVKPQTKLVVVSGLGNGFAVEESGSNPLVVGGGVGVVPLKALVISLLEVGKTPTVIYGFNTADEVFLAEETAELGVPVYIATADGSVGTRGFVTDALREISATVEQPFDYLYSCGPTPMLQALIQNIDVPGQFSMEQRMACGFGACMGCVVETVRGMERVCKEGPVFSRTDLVVEAK